jgi:hypothetical protein
MKSPFDPEVTRAINRFGRFGIAILDDVDAYFERIHAERVALMPRLIELMDALNNLDPYGAQTRADRAPFTADATEDEYTPDEAPEPHEPLYDRRKRPGPTTTRRPTPPNTRRPRTAAPSATAAASAPTSRTDTSTPPPAASAETEAPPPNPPPTPTAATEAPPPNPPPHTTTPPAPTVVAIDREALIPFVMQIIHESIAKLTTAPPAVPTADVIIEPAAATPDPAAATPETIEHAPTPAQPPDVITDLAAPSADPPDLGHDADKDGAEDLEGEADDHSLTERLPDLLDRAHAALDRSDWPAAIDDFEQLRRATQQHWQNTRDSAPAGVVLSASLRGAAEAYLHAGDTAAGMQRAQESFDVAGQVNRLERSRSSFSDFIASSVTLVLALDATGATPRAHRLLNTTVHLIKSSPSKTCAQVRENLAKLKSLAVFLKEREKQGISPSTPTPPR